MLDQINQWKKEESISSQTSTKNIEAELKIVETKLEKLVSAYLDEMIEKEIYLKKKEELIKKKIELLKRKKVFGQKDKNWLEPLRDWVVTANSVGKLASTNDIKEVRSFVEKIGSNRRLLARVASFDFKRPYDLLLKFNNFRAPKKQLESLSFSENAGNPVWRR